MTQTVLPVAAFGPLAGGVPNVPLYAAASACVVDIPSRLAVVLVASAAPDAVGEGGGAPLLLAPAPPLPLLEQAAKTRAPAIAVSKTVVLRPRRCTLVIACSVDMSHERGRSPLRGGARKLPPVRATERWCANIRPPRCGRCQDSVGQLYICPARSV